MPSEPSDPKICGIDVKIRRNDPKIFRIDTEICQSDDERCRIDCNFFPSTAAFSSSTAASGASTAGISVASNNDCTVDLEALLIGNKHCWSCLHSRTGTSMSTAAITIVW